MWNLPQRLMQCVQPKIDCAARVDTFQSLGFNEAVCLADSTRAMPPSTVRELRPSRVVKVSPSSRTPAMEAITGTVSCTVAARKDERCRTAAYQIAYPAPDAIVPDTTAEVIPTTSAWKEDMKGREVSMISGTDIMKLPAVAANGSVKPLPRIE